MSWFYVIIKGKVEWKRGRKESPSARCIPSSHALSYHFHRGLVDCVVVVVVLCGLERLKGPMTATRCGVISCYKLFWKSAPYDITCGRVHPDVC